MAESQPKGNPRAKSRASTPTEVAPVTVTLTPEHARHVAADFALSGVPGVEFSDEITRETLADARAALDQFEHRMSMVAWGESAEPVALTLQTEEMLILADRLIEGGADMAVHAAVLQGLEGLERLRKQRELFGEAVAGVAIIEQLTEAAS